ncbi:MAG: efflux RND transporter periplasmic adaptor subunit, partial [Pseudomonadota bacterium]
MSDVSKPLWRRVLRRTGILVSTVATAALAVGMVAGGSSLLSARAVKIDAGIVAPPTPVRVQSLEVVSGYQVPRRFVGQIEPP